MPAGSQALEEVEQSLLRGAALMSLAMVAAASIDVSVKALTGDFSTAQIVLLRSLFALPLLLVIVHRQTGVGSIVRVSWTWQLYRGFLTAGANFGFFYGLAHIPLVTAVMLAYVSPVLIVLLARPLLGESVGFTRGLGVAIGFAGVLVVLQPGRVTLEPAMLAILGSALCWALLSLSNRRLAGSVSSGVLAFYTVPVSAVLGALLTVGDWHPPASTDWLLFFIAGCAGGAAHLLTAMAYRWGQASAIAPFEYTALIWTALAGYLFWDEWPELAVWIGGVAVILGGYVALRARG